MRRLFSLLVFGTGLFALLLGGLSPSYLSAQQANDKPPAEEAERGAVSLIELDGVVDPVTASFVSTAIDEANERGDAALIIQMDTPGGLDTSMREIIKKMLASRAPVVVWVGPPGARAASAGAFITIAADVAAMAPGTNIGAAHPVNLGGGEPSDSEDEVLSEKATNDAIAYIRALAERHGRNADWAADAVKESISAQASEAEKLNVIDMVADDRSDLLQKLDGFETKEKGTIRVDATAPVNEIEMNWRERLLHTILNPNIAFILMLIGIWGLFFEFSNPGALYPGVIGAISLILALLAFQVLPINIGGVVLIVLAVTMFIIELITPTHGALTIGGVVALFFGSLILVDLPGGASISLAVIIPAVILTAAFFIFAIGAGLKAQRRKPTTGVSSLVGMTGVVQEAIDPDKGKGLVMVYGALWSAKSNGRLARGARVKVINVEGMTLTVEPLEEE